ncbi:hypothetical protein BJY04DRAFT_143447 [Aspergillus karnatakaensis]|uniref:uncharacterized protein n=1 Tax=Aspergillus karnatakaensis TaxID=1810916 RepID=UPI003CCDEFD4
MAGSTVGLDEWRIVFENVAREDLRNICLVSKSFNFLATPLLYRSISLTKTTYVFLKHEKQEPDLTRGHWNLLSRLEDDKNDSIRGFVQELNLLRVQRELLPVVLDWRFIQRLQERDCLLGLIDRLPNLRKVNLGVSGFQTDEMIRAIGAHKAGPELILDLTGGDCLSIDGPLPFVRGLRISASPVCPNDGSRPEILEVQRLLFNCSNLRSFSLRVNRPYGGCVMGGLLRSTWMGSFRLTGEEEFPALEELALDGYRMDDDEWMHWRDRFQWSNLLTLAIGPQATSKLLGHFAGYSTSLKTLRVFAYAGEGKPDHRELERFLMSFDTLTTLELKGYICSVDAIGHHMDMETLFLHEDEPTGKGIQRRVFTAQELDYLDERCPRLRSLAVDIQRGEDILPDDVLRKLATGFRCLNSLSIHFELGLTDLKHPIRPLLNYESAQGIGQALFDQRRFSGLDTSTSYTSYTVKLWTGKSFRRHPQWEPVYSRFEKRFTATYEISDPASDPCLRRLDGDERGRRGAVSDRVHVKGPQLNYVGYLSSI